jgi:uncharacterized protein YaiL (DUF2058 family)
MSPGGPLSVPLPATLRKRLARYAAQHQLKVATAARTLLDEKLRELDERSDLSRIEEWQRAQAWTAWQEVERNEAPLLELEEVLVAFDRATTRRRRRRT